MIGDSFTFGQGIPAEDRFSNRLEKAFNARAGKHSFEVLNFGRAGAETDDEIGILRDTVLPVEPDFVLLQWYANDMEGGDHSRRPRPLPLLPSTYLLRKLSERSALYFVAQSGWASLQRELGLLGSYEQYMRERFADPKGSDSVVADAALHNFFEVCRRHGVPVAVVLFPHLQAAPSYPFAEFHARLLERCEADDVPCVDLEDSLWSGERTEDIWVNPLDRHPGSEANRLAADGILERLEAEWLRAKAPDVE